MESMSSIPWTGPVSSPPGTVSRRPLNRTLRQNPRGCTEIEADPSKRQSHNGTPGPHTGTAGLAAHGHARNGRSGHASADGVDARRRDCDDAPAIVLLHGVGRMRWVREDRWRHCRGRLGHAARPRTTGDRCRATAPRTLSGRARPDRAMAARDAGRPRSRPQCRSRHASLPSRSGSPHPGAYRPVPWLPGRAPARLSAGGAIFIAARTRSEW